MLFEFNEDPVPWADTGQLIRGCLKGEGTTGLSIPNLDSLGRLAHADCLPNMTIGACRSSSPGLRSRKEEL